MADGNLNTDQLNWLNNNNKFPATFSLEGQTYNISNTDSSGHDPTVKQRLGKKGFVLKVEDKFGRKFAAKFSLPTEYDFDRDEVYEMKLVAQAGDNELFCFPVNAGRTEVFDGFPGNETNLVCFILPWIEGITLNDYLENSSTKLYPENIIEIMSELHRGISILQRKGLKHDDLHGGNVMLKKADPDSVFIDSENDNYKVIIIDTGSLKPWGKETEKAFDDSTHFIRNCIGLFNKFIKDRELCTSYPLFYIEFNKFIDKITDEDPSRISLLNIDHANEIQQAIQRLSNSLDASYTQGSVFHPFEAISAEHLADDKTLLSLFVNKLSWINDISNNAPTILTGPRGCGKSMVFRYMAAKTHLSAALQQCPPSLHDLGFLGIYISCSNELQNYLLWMVRDKRYEGKEIEISTFFQLVCLRELYKTISIVLSNPEARALYGLNDNTVYRSIVLINRYLPGDSDIEGIGTLSLSKRMVYRLDKLKSEVNRSFVNDSSTRLRLPYTVLGEVTEVIFNASAGLNDRPIVFLLDDYTTHRIGAPIQRILNKIIWERRHSHRFKVSAEKLGVNLEDIDGSRIDGDREYKEVDAGREGIDCTPLERKSFVKELLDARLVYAGWKGRAETLLGDNAIKSDNELAKICVESANRTGASYHYSGISIISNLWSGDIAHILNVLSKILARANVNPDTVSTIPSKIQHSAILSVSKSLFNRITSFHPYGNEMQELVNNYGKMVRDVMLYGKGQQETNEVIPRRLLRIDVEEENAGNYLAKIEEISGTETKKFAEELLRRALFIELPNSRSKDKKQTFRWHIRTLLLPHFGVALTANGAYIDLKNVNEFIEMLTDSNKFCELQKKKWNTTHAKPNAKPENQYDMF